MTLAAVLLSLMAQWVFIPLAEQVLSRAARRWASGEVEVRVEAFPAWQLLQGHLDRVKINAKEVRLNGLTLAELQGEFRQVRFSWWAAWHHGDFSYSFQEPGNIQVQVREEDLTQYLSGRWNLPLQDLAVAIAGTRVRLTASLVVAGQKLPVLLQGTMTLTPPGTIRVVPDRVQVGLLSPGPELREKLAAYTTFPLPLDTLPVRVEFHRLEGGEGQLTLHGSVWRR